MFIFFGLCKKKFGRREGEKPKKRGEQKGHFDQSFFLKKKEEEETMCTKRGFTNDNYV